MVKRIAYCISVLVVLLGVIFVPNWQSSHATPLTASSTWSTFMNGSAHTGYNGSETAINTGTASKLKLHWKYHAGGPISSEPVVANGAIYWGSWDGYEHATNLNGQQIWQAFLGKTTARGNCTPRSAGVAGSATVVPMAVKGASSVVFVGGGNARVYALDASNGHVLWSTALGTPPDYMIWSGTTVYQGNVYIGISSYGDCPLVPGKIFALSGTTGQILHSYTTVAAGCKGGGIWMVPTIDEANNALYISTGTIAPCRTPETGAYALIKLNATDLSFIASWQMPQSEWITDSDFGSTPTLFTAGARQMVGLINKNGIYYAFDRANISAGPVWQATLSTQHNNFAASAWDGSTLYTPATMTSINGVTCNGAIRAQDPGTGAVHWQYCAPGKIMGPLTAVPGLIIAGAGTCLVVVNASDGRQLFVYKDMSRGATFWAGSTVSNGVIYAGDGAGNLFAIGL